MPGFVAVDVFVSFIQTFTNAITERPRGFKTFFMLNSTEHKIATAYKH